MKMTTQYSVETRFLGKRLGIFDYTVSGLYYHETNLGHYSINQQALDIFQDFRQSTESYAVFGRVTAHLTDRLRLVGGIRYTDDEKSFNGTSTSLTIVCTLPTPTGPNCPQAPLFTLVPTAAQLTLPVPPAIGAVAPIIGARGFTGAIVARGGNTNNSTLSTDKVTYRGAVEYDLTPRSLLYASVETGYRTGGFSLAVGSRPTSRKRSSPIPSAQRTASSKTGCSSTSRPSGGLPQPAGQPPGHRPRWPAGSVHPKTSVNRPTKASRRRRATCLTPHTVLSADLQYLDANYDLVQIPGADR